MFASFRVRKSWSHPVPCSPLFRTTFLFMIQGDLIILTPYSVQNFPVMDQFDSSGASGEGPESYPLIRPAFMHWTSPRYFCCLLQVGHHIPTMLYFGRKSTGTSVGIYVPSKRPCVKPSLEWYMYTIVGPPSEQIWLFHSKYCLTYLDVTGLT